MPDPHTSTTHVGRHVPFKREGWGIAALVCLLAVLCAGGAWYVHNETYLHPTDVRNRTAGSSTPAAPH